MEILLGSPGLYRAVWPCEQQASHLSKFASKVVIVMFMPCLQLSCPLGLYYDEKAGDDKRQANLNHETFFAYGSNLHQHGAHILGGKTGFLTSGTKSSILQISAVVIRSDNSPFDLHSALNAPNRLPPCILPSIRSCRTSNDSLLWYLMLPYPGRLSNCS
jgi:hypothetical protein